MDQNKINDILTKQIGEAFSDEKFNLYTNINDLDNDLDTESKKQIYQLLKNNYNTNNNDSGNDTNNEDIIDKHINQIKQQYNQQYNQQSKNSELNLNIRQDKKKSNDIDLGFIRNKTSEGTRNDNSGLGFRNKPSERTRNDNSGLGFENETSEGTKNEISKETNEKIRQNNLLLELENRIKEKENKIMEKKKIKPLNIENKHKENIVDEVKNNLNELQKIEKQVNDVRNNSNNINNIIVTTSRNALLSGFIFIFLSSPHFLELFEKCLPKFKRDQGYSGIVFRGMLFMVIFTIISNLLNKYIFKQL